MRKIILSNRITLDGYMEGPNRSGDGTLLFKGLRHRVEFKLLDTRVFGNGNVLLVYRPLGKRD